MKPASRLLILALVLLLLCSALFFVLRSSRAVEPAAEEELVYSFSRTDITALSWKTAYGALSFLRSEDGQWTLAEDSGFPVDPAKLNSLADAVCSLCIIRSLEAPAPEEEYGLDHPAAEVCVETVSGSFSFRLGSVTSPEGYSYLSTEAAPLYLISGDASELFLLSLSDLMLKDSVPTMTDLLSFSISAQDHSLCIEYHPDSGLAYSPEYTRFIKTPDGYTALDTDLTDTLTASIRYLVLSDCTDYNATDAELKDYGLSPATATITVRYIGTEASETGMTDHLGNPILSSSETEQSFVLELGSYTDSGSCYARLFGSSQVYRISDDLVHTLLETDVSQLLPDDVLLLDWSTVSSVDLSLGQLVETVTFTEDGYFRLSDNASVPMSLLTTQLDALRSTGYATAPAENAQPLLSLHILRDDPQWPELTLSFFPLDEDNCITVLNGTATVLVAKSTVQMLMDDTVEFILNLY